MLRKLFQIGATSSDKKLPVALQRQSDYRALAQLFAAHVKHAQMTQKEHAEILEAWFYDGAHGMHLCTKHAQLLEIELDHQMNAANGKPSKAMIRSRLGDPDFKYATRGPLFRDRGGYYQVSTKPHPIRSHEDISADIDTLMGICTRLQIDLRDHAIEDRGTLKARLLTEDMMLQLRRHGPNSHYVRKL